MIIDRLKHPLDSRDYVIQADLELCLCLDAPDGQVDAIEAGINPHVELQQLKYFCLEGHLGPQALHLERDLLDFQVRDVKEDIRLIPAAPPVRWKLPAALITLLTVRAILLALLPALV